MRRFFDEHWIDAPVRDHKRGGAFCAYTVPSVHPYVLLNFTAQRRDVLTMAHELGHGLHAALSQSQGVFHHSTPLTLAETASVFGEALTFGRLLEQAPDDRARLHLLADRIDGAIATVFRQMAMNRFEHLVHTGRRTEGELSTERFAELWVQTQDELFGDSVEITDGYRTWWSYIPHFINTPGYVYAYAYGQLLALSVYHRYLAGGRVFVPRYLELLAAGGSRSPEELGAIVGIDLADPGFWDAGLDLVEGQLREAEELAARLVVGAGAAGPRALLLLLHHVGDQPEDLVRPGRLGVAVLERLAPLLDVALGGQLVEMRARDLQPDLGVGGRVLGDLRPRQLDPVVLDVPRRRATRARSTSFSGSSAGTSAMKRVTAVSIRVLVSAGVVRSSSLRRSAHSERAVTL